MQQWNKFVDATNMTIEYEHTHNESHAVMWFWQSFFEKGHQLLSCMKMTEIRWKNFRILGLNSQPHWWLASDYSSNYLDQPAPKMGKIGLSKDLLV